MKNKKAVLIIGAVVIILAVIIAFAINGGSGGNPEVSDYKVTLPEGYEESEQNYPVVYVMPRDGHSVDDSGVTEKLQAAIEIGLGADMIIVRPEFEEDTNIPKAMKNLVKEVDESYRTIADKKYRAVVGTGVGGYLSYVAGLTEQDDVFAAVASIRGDFVSEENTWYETYGDVSKELGKMQGRKDSVFDEFYTYIDAPVDDAWTNMEGSTNDIGSLFIGYGTGSAFHEFTVRIGEFTEEFLTESVNRVADRITKYMLSDIASGEIALESSSLTESVENANVSYTIEVEDAINAVVSGEIEGNVVVEVVDPVTGEVLAEASSPVKISGKEVHTGEVQVANMVNGASSKVKLSLQIFGAEIELASANLTRSQDVIIEGDYQKIDLSGDWYFNYTGRKRSFNLATISADEYKTWSVAQAGLENWKKGYGNISEENVNTSLGGEDYFDYMILGNGYYVKEFDVPEAFDSQELILSIGYVDDRCEVYLNGNRVGATGMDEWGNPTGDTTWAEYSKFELDPSLVIRGGKNVLAVRAYNDGPYGAGGWYQGPIGLYSKSVFSNPSGPGSQEEEITGFVEKTFKSSYAAQALGKSGTVDNEYLLYLPKDYDTTERYYPTVYLLHQFNSDHTSYQTDSIDEVLTKAMEEGLFDEMIVVVPNSAEESWWTGAWEKMITEELIPLIDSEYRTIQDARYRLTAGCSMGGQGAFGIALTNPDYFSGSVSFFGALSMPPTQAENALKIAKDESVDYMNYYTLYFICGNQDSYSFGIPAIDLNQILTERGIEHGFFIENGGHDSGFYVPYFNDTFAYVRNNMFKSDDAVEALLSGKLTVNGEKIEAEFDALEGIEKYFNAIPESSYTEEQNPDLAIPLMIQVIQDGVVVHQETETTYVNAGSRAVSYEYDFSKYQGKGCTVVLKVAIFDRVVTLDTVDMN